MFLCLNELSSLYGDKADTRYEVLQLWAQVEYTHLASPVNGSHIWRQIMGEQALLPVYKHCI